MKDILEKLTVEMNRVNPQGFARFNKGITPQEIDETLKGFPIPREKFTEVLELLQWRNGGLECGGRGFSVSLMPGLMLYSLREIVERYSLTKCSPACGKNLIPFTNDGSTGSHYYDIRDKTIVYDMGQIPSVHYRSMTGFLNKIYECYRDNIYFMDEEGFLNTDFKKQGKIFSSEIIIPKRKGWLG